jgi:putative cardiolipin synthase
MIARQLGKMFSTTLLLALLAGCASIDFDYPRSESRALTGTDQTYLGRQFTDLVASKPSGESGFLLLKDGIDALATRLFLIQRAERSIDLQYFILKTDVTGSVLLHRLLEAADRGVRVRLLLDDVDASGYDAGMAGLSSHPNFEIHVFNPFGRGFAGRPRSALTNFGRINRRMHNKTFIVDNQVAIIGGRNIADEYFDAREDARFSDQDVLAIGPVVTDASRMFDTYWNHETALPVPAFAEMPEDPAAELERVQHKFAAAREAILGTRYAAAVRQEVRDSNEIDTNAFSWAPYTLVYDSPDKGVKSRADEGDSIRTPLVESLESARSELVIVSPYFVPGKSGIDRFTALQAQGVQVIIITNSLASQDQLLVHSGYAPSRKPLLEHGVKIYEVRPDADQTGAEFVDPGDTTVSLHTKAFLVDRKALFVGSFNFDPRSAYLNTESGIIIRSEELSQEFAAAVNTALTRRTYEVFLNENGKLRWRYTREGEEVVYDKEPQTTWGRRFSAEFGRWLPIRGHL